MKKYINLLPPENQKEIRSSRINTHFLDFGIWVVLSLLVFSTVLFISFLILRGNLNAREEEVARENRALAEVKETSVRKEVEDYNQNLTNFQTLAETSETWSKVLIEIAKNLPINLTIDSLSINRLDHKVELSGHAATRGAVLDFRHNLLNSRMFSRVNFPLSNLEKPAELNWKYRFFFNPDFLK